MWVLGGGFVSIHVVPRYPHIFEGEVGGEQRQTTKEVPSSQHHVGVDSSPPPPPQYNTGALAQHDPASSSSLQTVVTSPQSSHIPVVACVLFAPFDADTLEIRLNELEGLVDHTFLVESDRDHRKRKKPFFWETVFQHQPRFQRFRDKVSLLKVFSNIPETPKDRSADEGEKDRFQEKINPHERRPAQDHDRPRPQDHEPRPQDHESRPEDHEPRPQNERPQNERPQNGRSDDSRSSVFEETDQQVQRIETLRRTAQQQLLADFLVEGEQMAQATNLLQTALRERGVRFAAVVGGDCDELPSRRVVHVLRHCVPKKQYAIGGEPLVVSSVMMMGNADFAIRSDWAAEAETPYSIGVPTVVYFHEKNEIGGKTSTLEHLVHAVWDPKVRFQGGRNVLHGGVHMTSYPYPYYRVLKAWTCSECDYNDKTTLRTFLQGVLPSSAGLEREESPLSSSAGLEPPDSSGWARRTSADLRTTTAGTAKESGGVGPLLSSVEREDRRERVRRWYTQSGTPQDPLWGPRMKSMKELVAEEGDQFSRIVGLPNFLLANKERYPSWFGRPDSRLLFEGDADVFS